MLFSKKTLLFLAMVLFSMALITFNTKGQGINVRQKTDREFLIRYMLTFDTWVNNPDSLLFNKSQFLYFFRNPEKKTVVDFLAKQQNKSKISPHDLTNYLALYFPDGVAMVYDTTKINMQESKGCFGTKITAYTFPAEYSAIRKDGSLMHQKDPLYYYIRNKKNKAQLAGIASKKQHKKSFLNHFYRKGIFLELTGGLTAASMDLPLQTDTVATMAKMSLTPNGGVSIVFMPFPFLGVGTGYGSWNITTSNLYDINIIQQHNSLLGESSLQTTGLEQKTDMVAVAIPLFLRLQAGRKKIALVAEMGFNYIPKPWYYTYLKGSITKTQYNNPDLVLDYSGTLTSSLQDTENRITFFQRLGVSLHPSKYFYLRLSGTMHSSLKNTYKKERHPFDIYSLGMTSDNWQSIVKLSTFDCTVGFNLGQLFTRH